MASARTVALLCVGLALAVARPASGFHTVFHFQVDRFEADGNAFGPADGMPDLVDDFDDVASYEQQWRRLFGTVAVSDGMLHLQSPGEHYLISFPVDVSEAMSTWSLDPADGAVTFTSHWLPPALTPGSSMHMTLALLAMDGRQEYVGVHTQQLGDQGPVLGFHVIEFTPIGFSAVGKWEVIRVDTMPFDPALVLDRLVLRLAIADGKVGASVSVDGGTTFQQPFDTAPIVNGMDQAQVLLGADPNVPMPPVCGDRNLDPGEACDRGAKGDTCCTAACTLVDADGDGVCDPKDDCPSVADPTQADGDGDGSGDACDPCTVTIEGQSHWQRPRVTVTHVNDGRPGNESLHVSGTFRPAGDGIIDPVATGARLTLRSRKDGSTIAIDLPAGPGWRADKSGNAFTYTDRSRGGTAGVRRMTVRRFDDGTIRIAVSGRGSFNFGPWSFPPIDTTVAFGDTLGACGAIVFERTCAYPASRKIVCR